MVSFNPEHKGLRWNSISTKDTERGNDLQVSTETGRAAENNHLNNHLNNSLVNRKDFREKMDMDSSLTQKLREGYAILTCLVCSCYYSMVP